MVFGIGTNLWGAETVSATRHYWLTNSPTYAGSTIFLIKKEGQRQEVSFLKQEKQKSYLIEKRNLAKIKKLANQLTDLTIDDSDDSVDMTPNAPKHASKDKEEKRPF
jgi:hypothetical protein